MIGDRLGDWILDKELGRGGMGTVYLARRHTEAGAEEPTQCAAVKVLALQWTTDPASRERFQREIDVLKKLDHPNVVRLIDHGTHHGMHYYVMEHVDGANLEEVLRASGRLRWEQVLDAALQVCLALKHAHDHGIIHRDLKPSNLLRGAPPSEADDESHVGRFGRIKLTDFGIAWVFAAPHLTKPGAIVGTAEYLSPEQAAGKQPSKKSDVYSLGVVLYALLTGKPPFEGEVVDLLHKHRYAQFDPPHKIVADLPRDFDALILQMLEKDPAKRPPDAGVLYRQLDSLRRKYQRRSAQATSQDLADKSTAIEDEASAPVGPATLMAELVRQELHRQNRGGPIRRTFNHPIVLLALFAVTVGVLTWTFWPLSMSALHQRAIAHVSSDDWLAAEKDIDELERRFPNHPHQKEVRQWREKIAEHRAMQESAREARFAGPMSETKWFFEKGARLYQIGNIDEAKETWTNLIAAFGGKAGDVEDPWVRRARKALESPEEYVQTEEARRKLVDAAVGRVRKLEREKSSSAAQAREVLLKLYENEPSQRQAIVERLQAER